MVITEVRRTDNASLQRYLWTVIALLLLSGCKNSIFNSTIKHQNPKVRALQYQQIKEKGNANRPSPYLYKRRPVMNPGGTGFDQNKQFARSYTNYLQSRIDHNKIDASLVLDIDNFQFKNNIKPKPSRIKYLFDINNNAVTPASTINYNDRMPYNIWTNHGASDNYSGKKSYAGISMINAQGVDISRLNGAHYVTYGYDYNSSTNNRKRTLFASNRQVRKKLNNGIDVNELYSGVNVRNINLQQSQNNYSLRPISSELEQQNDKINHDGCIKACANYNGIMLCNKINDYDHLERKDELSATADNDVNKKNDSLELIQTTYNDQNRLTNDHNIDNGGANPLPMINHYTEEKYSIVDDQS